MARSDSPYNDSLGKKADRAADKALDSHDEPSTTGDKVGQATGGLAGAATGAALGSLGGPIGTVIGGIAGAATGWWTGRAVSEAASSFDNDEDYYRKHFESSRSRSSGQYDTARPAYQLGHVASMNPDYEGRQFEEVEGDLRRGWSGDVSARYGQWDDVRGYARDAYDRGREQRLTLSEEQLSVGKRQVQGGEVHLKKTVETRHVQESVPLTHEEVTIERRPLSANDAANLKIGEESVSVELMAEEAVVGKRVVGTEEVIVRKQSVTENQTVEGDVRRERLVTEGLDEQGKSRSGGQTRAASGSGMSGADDRATDSGLLDRAADKLDNVKDRVDGNPASKPGPDRTDKRI